MPALVPAVKNASVDLLSGLQGWPKILAYFGALGLCLLVMTWIIVVQMPRERAQCLEEMRQERVSEDSKSQRLLNLMTAQQRDNVQHHEEMTTALRDCQHAIDALTWELRKANSAKRVEEASEKRPPLPP